MPLALDPEEAADRLEGLRPSSKSSLDLQLMRYRPHMRALIEYTYRSARGDPELQIIGKMYGDEDKTEASWRGLNSLAEQAGETLVTPLPLHLVPAWRLIAMQKVEGLPLSPVLLGGSSQEAEQAIQLTAKALQRFHSFELPREESRSLDEELVEIRDQADKFSSLAGWLSESANELARKVEPLLGGDLQPARPSLVHGAFKADQVLVNDSGAVIGDLDGSAQDDPALDLGNFAAKQFKEARDPSRAHLHDFGRALSDAYAELPDDSTLANRCGLYEAIALSRLAFRELHTAHRDSAEQGQESSSGRLMQRAQSLLATVG